ncbi:Phosphoglycolate phosphatase [subsurface metagenome]
MQLAIDTSTDTASIAIVQDSQVLAELTWHCGQNHTTELLPHLFHLLTQSKISLESINGIIVARGPGSFNGLRVGISTAKGLALSLGSPIVGISTLEVAAYPHAETGLPICPIFNAGRGEIATAVYQKKNKGWRQLVAEHITTVDSLCSQITTKTIFCGDFIPFIAPQIRKQLKQKAIILPPATLLQRASFLAELGLKRLEAGDFDNLATLQPLYLRRPPITKPKRGSATYAITNTNPRAIIWDMDGIIADTAPYHLKAWQQVFQRRDVKFTEKDFRCKFGQRNDTIIRNTLGQGTPQSEVDAIIREKESNFRKRVRQRIRPLPGAINLINLLAERGFKMALASSAPIENIRLLINGLGITDYFQAIISGKDVAEGKPSPQGFLLAAQRLGVTPENCIVIEDAIAGVTAAKKAGMHCLAVTNTHPKASLKEADLIVATLEAVSINDLEGLLAPSREGLF